MLLPTCNRIPCPTRARHKSSRGKSEGAAKRSIRVRIHHTSKDCVDHCQTLLPQKSGHSWILLVVGSGDAHPVVEVWHNVRRASSWRVLQRFPEPLCETVQCLCMGRSAARVLRLWVAETSHISLMACASSPREKSFWRSLAADPHDVSADADQFHDTLALEMSSSSWARFQSCPKSHSILSSVG